MKIFMTIGPMPKNKLRADALRKELKRVGFQSEAPNEQPHTKWVGPSIGIPYSVLFSRGIETVLVEAADEGDD